MWSPRIGLWRGTGAARSVLHISKKSTFGEKCGAPHFSPSAGSCEPAPQASPTAIPASAGICISAQTRQILDRQSADDPRTLEKCRHPPTRRSAPGHRSPCGPSSAPARTSGPRSSRPLRSVSVPPGRSGPVATGLRQLCAGPVGTHPMRTSSCRAVALTPIRRRLVASSRGRRSGWSGSPRDHVM
jgi:hypothetical protein